MPRYSSYNALGSSIEASEMSADAVTTVKIADGAVTPVKSDGFPKLVETNTLASAGATIGFSSLTVSATKILIIGNVVCAGASNLSMTLNSSISTSANVQALAVSGASVTANSASTGIGFANTTAGKFEMLLTKDESNIWRGSCKCNVGNSYRIYDFAFASAIAGNITDIDITGSANFSIGSSLSVYEFDT